MNLLLDGLPIHLLQQLTKPILIVASSGVNENVSDKTTTLPIPTLSSYTLLKTFNFKA